MFLTLAILMTSVLAPAQSDTVRRETVERDLARLIRSDTVPGPPGEGTVRVVGFNVDTKDTLGSLGGFVRDHGRLLWYLATHTRGAEARMLPLRADPEPVRDSIRAALLGNDAFMQRLMMMLTRYGASHHQIVLGSAPAAEIATVSSSELSALGVRFFYPDRFSDDGTTMFTHICAGANGLSDFPAPVDPLIEAFTFVAVNRAVFKPHSALMSDYEAAAKRAKVVSASKDVATRIRRAQGALWMQLEQSAALKEAIASEYAVSKDILPFRLKTAR
jgi:hypothetical protein